MNKTIKDFKVLYPFETGYIFAVVVEHTGTSFRTSYFTFITDRELNIKEQLSPDLTKLIKAKLKSYRLKLLFE